MSGVVGEGDGTSQLASEAAAAGSWQLASVLATSSRRGELFLSSTHYKNKTMEKKRKEERGRKNLLVPARLSVGSRRTS